MSKFIKEFDLRWSDLDANRHVANVTYSILTIEARMAMLRTYGITHKVLEELQIGPVILTEEYNYLREVLPDEKVYVEIELAGRAEDSKIVRFAHCLFKQSGELAMYCEVTVGWISLVTRKLVTPSQNLLDVLDLLPKSHHFHLLSKEELRQTKVPYGKTMGS
jgi:acyl-CoA thioester hydrolase